MPRDLFGDVTRPSISIGSRKWYTLPLSLVSHSAIVLVIVAIPVLAPTVMPSVFADNKLTVVTIDLPDPPPVPQPRPIKINDVPPPAYPRAPTVAPTGINPERPAPEAGWEDRLESRIDGIVNPDTFAPPPPPEVKAPPQPVRVGFSGVRTPVKTRDVRPVYPRVALEARIEGVVIIEATISQAGQVINAKLLRGAPLLDQAALDAVRQWEFTPTLLNGVPVPVIMTVTVTFTLSK